MMSRQSRDFLTAVVFIVLAVFTITSDARSWDIAVVIDNEINFFTQNRTLTEEVKIDGAVSLSGIAYDDQTNTLYLSDTRSNISIFSYDLTKNNSNSKPLLMGEKNESYIASTVFDSRSRTLFWIESWNRKIMKMHVPLNGPPEEPVVLHNLTQLPRGIVLDTCNSYIYWSNSDRYNSTIERSKMDGTNRTVIIKENLYIPVGLAIDYEEGKLYWIDDEEGIDMKIERSNLDGTEREIFLRNRNQQPIYIALDTDFVYWSDWVHRAIWMMAKNSTDHESLIKFKSYHRTNKDGDPNAIITRENGGTIDCPAVIKRRLEKKKLAEHQRKIEFVNNLTANIKKVKTENSQFCLNGGSFDRIKHSCNCKSGYTGSVCETSLCQNYCLQGDCTVNSFGEAECKCIGTFTGKRCERDICEGYCLHDGECSVQNNVPICECKNSKGRRCEIPVDEVDVEKSTCSLICAENNNYTSERMQTLNENCESNTLLFVLIGLIIVLIILILVMSFYLHKLRRRPRIKKRFVVSKGGITPLTSRPQLPDNQCEITIENCCNMNICETPCFEPKLRTPMTKNIKAKKDEKNSLLDNMEGNSC